MKKDCVKIFENGNINIKLSKDTLKEICRYRSTHDNNEDTYNHVMNAAQEDILEHMESEECYEYGWNGLSCMTWSTCDYHDLYYNPGLDMKYDFSHNDIWNVLCEGRTLKIQGEKITSDGYRKDIYRWILDEHGYEEEDYDDFGIGYDDDESEAV